MLDAGARPAGWIGVSVDLTKRLESERALRAASNYLQAVADSLGDGLFTLDTEGRVSYVNEAAEQLLGWSRDELLGRVMHEIAHCRSLAARPRGLADPERPLRRARTARRRRLHPPQRRRAARRLHRRAVRDRRRGAGLRRRLRGHLGAQGARGEPASARPRSCRGSGASRKRSRTIASSSSPSRSSTCAAARSSRTSCCCACANATGRSSHRARSCRSPRSTG